jgi:Domain of unknown function (DUF222)
MFDIGGVKDPVETLLQHTAAVQRIGEVVPGGLPGLTCARDAQVLDLVSAAQAVIRSAQGMLAVASGELSRRSQGDAESSLSRRSGEKNATLLVAHRAGLSLGEAARLVVVGDAITPQVALSGEDLPPKRPYLAQAIAAGTITVALAEVIERTLSAVAHVLWVDQAEGLEKMLVDRAASDVWSVADFIAFCKRIPGTLDPDGSKPRDDALRKKAFIRETELANGMLRIVAELDPERAGFWRAALRAKTNPRRDGGETGAATGGSRGADGTTPTPMEAKLDGLTAILRGSLCADDGRTGGVDTTVLVRIDLADLLSGLGSASIDGIQEPISAAAARRLAAEADLIPQVFDGKSVLLDQGESKRVFTKAQRYAILGMFLGCAFPKCDIPSSMTEIHHVGPWATRSKHGKGTDLLNGLPLCGFHNRLMEQGWEVVFDEAHEPWFIPPATIDPTRTPIRGGTLAHEHAA